MENNVSGSLAGAQSLASSSPKKVKLLQKSPKNYLIYYYYKFRRPVFYLLQIFLGMIGSALFTKGFTDIIWTEQAVDIEYLAKNKDKPFDPQERVKAIQAKKNGCIILLVVGILLVVCAVGIFVFTQYLQYNSKDVTYQLGSSPTSEK